MSEKDRTRFLVPEKPKHPLGWACEFCFHVVKEPSGSGAMKCTRFPPHPQAVMGPGNQLQFLSISPPVNKGEWCGEYAITPSKLDA